MLEAMAKAKEGTLLFCTRLSSHSGALALTTRLDGIKNFPRIITCPSEMVALSAAIGYAQVTAIPVESAQPLFCWGE
jgi:hypothetical protein